MRTPRSYSASARRPSGSISLKPPSCWRAFSWCTSPWTSTDLSSRCACPRRRAQARAWSTVFSEHGRSSSSHDVTMKSASHRALVAPRGQPAVWRRPPYARSGGAENLQATGERQSKPIHGPAQPLHEQRALVGVVPVEHRASVSADEAEDGRLVGGVVPGPWDEHLQDGRGTIRPGRVRHEGLGAALVGVPDCDRPVGLQARDKRRQSLEPVLGADGAGLVSHNRPHLDHCSSLTEAE